MSLATATIALRTDKYRHGPVRADTDRDGPTLTGTDRPGRADGLPSATGQQANRTLFTPPDALTRGWRSCCRGDSLAEPGRSTAPAGAARGGYRDAIGGRTSPGRRERIAASVPGVAVAATAVVDDGWGRR